MDITAETPIKFKKILVANRGEIAIRVLRAANEMNIRTIAVFAEEDKLSLHRFKADEAYRIGAGLGPVAAYLSIDEIIRIAKLSKADAIHPGYGLLSENPDFEDACTKNGISFIGPNADTMRALGDKASARRVAIRAGVPVIPACDISETDISQTRAAAEKIGYPLMLKAAWGGGGRGMRAINAASELEGKIAEGRREAEAAFGNGEGYLEKMIQRARHVEVQILGDKYGKIYHLFERDCSIQRRNQKVVERAPAPYLSDAARARVCEYATRICAEVGYYCAGTVEFLLDMDSDEIYFIEVNPRIQVEHTVTEEITGIDIVRAQILIAAGYNLESATGATRQEDITLNGHAMQCRITSEDPANNFIPDYGTISAYRAATGMGVRLDGSAYSGAIISRHYDSLLEKITVWAETPDAAIARMIRALKEFRIRGVATNIAFVENLLQHPTFLANAYHTKFIDQTSELFKFKRKRDRATKILTYLAEITVNGHPESAHSPRPARAAHTAADIFIPDGQPLPDGTKTRLEKHGADAIIDWLNSEKQVLITDTTMRDGHQSLLETRMRSFDMLRIAPAYAAKLSNLFSIECWGGATFDVAYRFLQECPWQRLRDLRRAMPNVMLQMLVRGANAVGYTNYPDNVVRAFIAQAAKTGVDVFRVFDSLNWVENMRVAIDAVRETGRLCEGTICYTGDMLDPNRAKYNLKYYITMGKDLRDAGAHIIAVKDMAGLLRPDATRLLITALKEEVGLPVHLHTHDTSGISAASVIAAVDAGVDIIDAAMDSFSGGTSQPCLGSLLVALTHTPRAPKISAQQVRKISDYWGDVRKIYSAFESGLSAPASEIYLHEMPGGQFTNLKAQARSMGLEKRWEEVAQAYSDANQIFGDIVKVTPSSKVVGDMALMMVAQNLTRADVEDPNIEMAFPDSVVDMLSGNLGQPLGGFPEKIVKKALKGSTPITERPGKLLAAVDLEEKRKSLSAELNGFRVDDEDLLGYLLYPKVFLDYMGRHRRFGPVRTLPTPNFFYGMEPGEEITVEIDPGKALEIQLQTVGEADHEGYVRVFFELNGQPRTIRILNQHAKTTRTVRPRAEDGNSAHIGAPMAGTIAALNVKAGEEIAAGTLLATIEAMKMETGLYSEQAGTVAKIYVAQGDQVDAKDLLIELTSS